MRAGATIAAAGMAIAALSGCQGGSDHESSGIAPSQTPSRSSPTSTSLDAATISRADAACTPNAKWIGSHPNVAPVPGFDYQNPDPSLLPKVATYLEKVPIYHGLADTLARLDPPKQGSQVWRRLVQDARRFETISQSQINAARHADAAAWTNELAHKLALFKTLDGDIEGAGFTVGSPCWVALHS